MELHADEVTTIPPPPCIFVLTPRLGYLHQIAEVALAHFKDALPPGVDEPWFEYKDVPLKWHIPAGVLFDLLGQGPQPWNLVVHFRAYPHAQILPYSSEASLHSSFLNSLKEAVYVLTGSAAPVLSLSKSSQESLWADIEGSNPDGFYASLGKIDALRPTRGRIPVRVYYRKKAFDSFTQWKSVEYASRSVRIPGDAAGEEAETLGSALLSVMGAEALDGSEVLIAGIPVSTEARIDVLYENLKNPDMWLYVCVLHGGEAG